MGCGDSQPKDEKNEQVSEEIEKDRQEDTKIKKLLLLGAGGSGKSTFFKQLQNLHGGGFAKRDRKTFRSQIYEQMIEAMKIMITKCEEFYEDDEEENKDYELEEESQASADYILATRNNVEMSEDIAKHLAILWKDPAIQKVFAIRNKICVPDSTEHFFKGLDRVTDDEYTPTDEDLLLVRYRTTGMAEKEFIIDGTTFQICDVGGQRNERRKWIHFFDNVTAVLFVASLSSYDEVPFEDETANSMIEGLEVFGEQCNSHWFAATAFILFLNKKDLFEEKIKKVPITTAFPEYTGKQTYDESLNYIKSRFDEQNSNPEERQIYIHVTTATDTNNVQKVFNDVQHVVINWSLQRSGLF